jgi:hypothetical protein
MAKKTAPRKKDAPQRKAGQQKKATPPKNIATPKKTASQTTVVPKKTLVAPTKTPTAAQLDDGFMDLLKLANASENVPASTINPTVIRLFESALKLVKDAKTSIEQDRDIRKDILTTIELLQFGISELKKLNK